MAGHCAEHVAGAAAELARQPDDLALVDLEAHRFDQVLGEEVLDVEDQGSGSGGPLREQAFQRAPEHHGDELVEGEGAGRGRVARPAVAEHRHPIGEIEHLVEAMGHVDDGAVLLAQRADHCLDSLYLPVCEGRGRLVEYHHPGVAGQQAGHFDQLPLSHREVFDRGAGIQLPQAHLLQIGHGRPGQRPRRGCPPPSRVAQEDVVGDGEAGNQRELLLDDRDAGVLGLGRAPEVDLGTPQADRALVGRVHPGQDLDQCALARAVLADEGHHLSVADLEVGLVQGLYRAERLRQGVDPQVWLG